VVGHSVRLVLEWIVDRSDRKFRLQHARRERGQRRNGLRRIRRKNRNPAQTPVEAARRLSVERWFGLLLMVAASLFSPYAKRSRGSCRAPGRQSAGRTFRCFGLLGDSGSKHGCSLRHQRERGEQSIRPDYRAPVGENCDIFQVCPAEAGTKIQRPSTAGSNSDTMKSEGPG
jgi:hypothetical protein